MNSVLIVCIPLFPLLAVVVNGLLGRLLKEKTGVIACAAMLGTVVCSVALWLKLAAGGAPMRVVLFEWIHVGGLAVDWAFAVDQLAAVMLLIVSIVGSLVFIYAMGYMHGDPGYFRFFTYLPLFAFAMYILVLGDSFPVLFVGWEGVGLCSYLLIGFWYKEMFSETMSNAGAGRKAFIVNRIGDFGFVLGMALIYWCFGTLHIGEVGAAATDLFGHDLDSPWMIAITLLLFIGATGKSAQIPLFVWLPDAMAGPTPVSALIHAATMVTAGVYMVARASHLFVLAPTTMAVVAIIGGCTAFLAATIAVTQRDIKKVLAYSTVSQLGYMFLACGCGAFATGIFHTFTHAFFKGGLFLCAGSVIHALHHEQDLFRMGGLRAKMPRTAWTYLWCCLAIAGIPPFAGFFSKDAILESAFAVHDALYTALWVLAMATALLTAFYMWRSYWLAFCGPCRVDKHRLEHLHESPPVMTVPLAILAVAALVSGAVGIPFFKHLHLGIPDINYFGAFLEHAVAHVPHGALEHAELSGLAVVGLTLLSVVVALSGLWAAGAIYARDWPKTAESWRRSLRPLHDLSFHKWWVDELYETSVVRGLWGLSALLLGTDRWVVDGVVNGTGSCSRSLSATLRLLQNGRVQGYALIMLLAALVIAVLLIVAQQPVAL